MSRILFITSNRIGDAVLSTAALEAARARLDGAGIVVVCGPLPAPLFRATPGLERLCTIEKRAGRWRDLWRDLRGDRYDLAVDLRGSLLTLGLSARQRIIHRKSHVIRHKLDELAALMKVSALPPPRLWIDGAAASAAAAALGSSRPFLALGPGANFIGKCWPPEGFARLAERLVSGEGPMRDARVVLLGAPNERPTCDQIAARLADSGIEALNLAGSLDLLGVAAAVSSATLFVGNDSGLMHIAAAVGAPTLGLFGPSDERVYGPRGPRAASVRVPKSFEDVISIGYIPHIQHTLMGDLAVETVEEAAREILAKGGLG